MAIRTYLGDQVLGILANYDVDSISVHVCCVYPRWDNRLRIFFPKGHDLTVGSLATVHLDNRTGVTEFDEELRVYRASYKGIVTEVDEDWVMLDPRECLMFHGNKITLDIRQPGYIYPEDSRPEHELRPTSLQSIHSVSQNDHQNKVGVLITRAKEQPHTTVLAFLSSDEDDIFFITVPETFKAKLLKRDPRCYFVIDERATFTFDRSIEWNYTIIEGEAFQVPRGDKIFEEVRDEFIFKNPWEIAFFTRTDLEMFHIKRNRIVCPGEHRSPG